MNKIASNPAIIAVLGIFAGTLVGLGWFWRAGEVLMAHAIASIPPPVVVEDSPDYLPPNSYAPARVIVGVDASAGVASQTDPLPVVLRITGPARSVMQNGKVLTTRIQGCVVNGAAYGPGFGLVLAGKGGVSHTPDKTSLAHALVQRFFA